MGSRQDGDAANEVRRDLRRTYSDLANRPVAEMGAGCCDAGPANGLTQTAGDRAPVPSLGCGDPVTPAALRSGQTVLDLGSGAGGDCLRAARLVGDAGRVIGVDMTPAMVDAARDQAARAGARNVEFRLGDIERIPAEDESVDVVMSNCVVNLSPDPEAVFREAFRVLKAGGVLAISDVLIDRPFPDAIGRRLLATAPGPARLPLDEPRYVAAIETAGFSLVEVTRTYMARTAAPGAHAVAGEATGRGRTARISLRIGETGDSAGELEIGEPLDVAAIPRSVRVTLRASKPVSSGRPR